MRIALVSPYDLDVVGGVQSHVMELGGRLGALGDDVLVLGPGDPAVVTGHGGGTEVVRVGRARAVPANGSRAPLALGVAAARRTVAELRRFGPDVIQVHEPLVPLVGPVAALAGIAPTVVTFHAQASAGALPVLARAARPLGRAIVRRAAAATAVSPVAAAFHAGALGLDASTLRVIPNGVDVARFGGRPRPGPSDAARTLLFVGRLEPRKGADLALAAFVRLASERPGLRLRIVGAGPLEDDLRRRVAALAPAVGDRVEFRGRVPQDRLPAELVAADVALVPARGGESFGIVLLELMAAGTPIVAADIPGYRAVARPDREAVLVPVEDDAALARAAALVLDDPTLAARLVAAGRLRAAAFDWDRVATDVRDVLAAAAGPGASARGA